MDITQKAAKVAEKMGMKRVKFDDNKHGYLDSDDYVCCLEHDKYHQDALALRCLREMANSGKFMDSALADLLYKGNEAIFDAYLAWKEGK